MMDIQEIPFQWFKDCLVNKALGVGIKNENISNMELTKELNKPIIRKFEKLKVYSTFIEIFGMLILRICNYLANLLKGFLFY